MFNVSASFQKEPYFSNLLFEWIWLYRNSVQFRKLQNFENYFQSNSFKLHVANLS